MIYRAHQLDKIEVLARVLQSRGRGLSIVFMRTKRQADRVAQELIDRGFAAAPLHGDLGQGAREQALRAFRNGKVDVLIATDVAARGIDVEDVTHVINWNCPDDDKTYLHRTGRTGRAGKKGTALTFVDWEDLARWSLIARQLGLPSTEAVETYSTSDHLFTDLDIPVDTKGVLPTNKRTRKGLDAEVIEDLGGPESRGRGGNRERRGGRGGSQDSRRKDGSKQHHPQREAEKQERRKASDEKEQPRRSRNRRRTRRVNGKVVEGGAGVPASEAKSSERSTSSESGSAADDGTPRRRSRGGRRRRGGRSKEQGSAPSSEN